MVCGGVSALGVGGQFSIQGGTDANLASGEFVFDPGVDKVQATVMAKIQEFLFG